MKLWNVSIREAAEDRGRKKLKDGVTKYLVHADTREEAEKIAIESFKGDLPRKRWSGILSWEEVGRCLWSGYYLTEEPIDPKKWRPSPMGW